MQRRKKLVLTLDFNDEVKSPGDYCTPEDIRAKIAKCRDAGVDRIQEKGADKSLVLMDDLALIVSARNRVVITALDAASAREGVFTGIDSAVIV